MNRKANFFNPSFRRAYIALGKHVSDNFQVFHKELKFPAPGVVVRGT
ncbi:MAG: hypothetical protein ABSD98_05475 [Candidatus Korobacteraceae bacterium]|jgi:hypothetical protein